MNHNPVGWFEIYVQDMDCAKRFYESVFQTKLERLESPAGIPVEPVEFSHDEGSNGRIRRAG